ncbi:MAG: helix-turn-helix domain-containing protein [Bauldia sp.]|uniref:helix-turn-helix domain-containing protein n=1 Tax=Bauldia sp. TaxID=2575872 RepID=UPI001DFDE577|nr:helix-turn-helix domain-containing protein [Bauldia sp.]MCB1496286.1 helix-turn-helix domain-containing protein [Bauldia sp.]
MLHQESKHILDQEVGRFSQTRPRAESVPLADAFASVGVSVRYARNSEIYGEGEPVDNVYRVVSGAVRTYKLLSDGRRQIGDFHIQGDVFGLEIGTERHFTAEAIADAVVLVAKRSALVSLAGKDPSLSAELWTHTAKELKRAQDHLLLLGRKRAQERVATFLLDMAGRGCSDIVLDLPMSRQDIADYLGLTIETVSRTLTRLECDMAIEIPTSRRIVLRDRQALGHLNS